MRKFSNFFRKLSNTSSRLKEFIDYKGIKPRTLEIKIGASNGALSKPIAKKKEIGTEWLIKILEHYPEINPEWLLLEKGQMFRKNSNNVTEEVKKQQESLVDQMDDLSGRTYQDLTPKKVSFKFDDPQKEIERLNNELEESKRDNERLTIKIETLNEQLDRVYKVLGETKSSKQRAKTL